jgi:alkylation response protein AidB-like acyl-CoA dehydrogenase
MAENYYLDNKDLQFLMERVVDWEAIVKWKEDVGTQDSIYGSAQEAADTYLDMLKDPVGAIAAERIQPRAAEIDREGCRFENGEVIFPELLKKNLEDMKRAQLMGITISSEYGGLNFPKTFYTAATEIISRADASLMNFFGLQGIAETIAVFASDELKQKYLPRMCSGELTGSMDLTEPDAGSDLGAVQLRAALDPKTDRWTVKGTKRFITNGCADVHLVLARSEDPEKYAGGRGLSFFLVEKGPKVKVRRIEHKLGIHGSPTCELFFDGAPAYLIGQRGRGLAKYTAWLMKEARLGVAAQAVGIAEAALTEARKYANEREQFGKKIKDFAPVAEMLLEMQVSIAAARALLYSASQIVDLEAGATRKGLKEEERKYGRLSDIFTPLVKYYAAEMSNRVASDAIQIHGGSGYTVEYPVERFYRDARITNIYEGTSQIQIVWAMPRILKGELDDILDELTLKKFTDSELQMLMERTRKAYAALREAVEYVKTQDSEYRDLAARRIVDMTIDVMVAGLFLAHAEKCDWKRGIIRKFIMDMLPRVEMNRELILMGERLEPALL